MDFDQPYSRADFVTFISRFIPDFQSKNLNVLDVYLPLHDALLLGSSDKLGLIVLEVSTSNEVEGRVALARAAVRLITSMGEEKALVVFRSDQDESQWRLSLVSFRPQIIDGKRTSNISDPKRHSFLLGRGAKTGTPYRLLETSGPVTSYADLEDRFSVEVVNNEFYRSIARFYDELLDMSFSNGEKVTSDFAIRLIGRLIFCWFLKEKSSEHNVPLLDDRHLSSALIRDGGTYAESIAPLFFEVLNVPVDERVGLASSELFKNVPYLNGGLFARQDHDADQNGHELVSDSWLARIFQLFEEYNFTVDENTTVDVDLSIDPEMLGRIFENLLARINPETSEASRKATGSFYTPRHVVDLMVQETLAAYLEIETNISAVTVQAILQDHIELGSDLVVSEDEKLEVIQALLCIRVLDPACGSGAFPIGVLQRILAVFYSLDPDGQIWLLAMKEQLNTKSFSKLKNELSSGNLRFHQKMFLIRETLFGADIQPVAVEIAKLRSFLTLIVDQPVSDNLGNRGIQPLPNLNFKFVSANSLVPLDDENSLKFGEDVQLLEDLVAVRDEYFSTQRSAKKRDLVNRYERLVNAEMTLFGESKRTSELKTYRPFEPNASSTFFDSSVMFGVNEFDVIIGNPPYVSTKGVSIEQKKVLEGVYGFADDLYTHFFFRSLDLLKQNGVLAFISSKSFWTIQSKKALRKLLLNNQLRLLVDASNPFEAALVDTCIVVSVKGAITTHSKFGVLNGTSRVLSDHTEFDQQIFNQVFGECFFPPDVLNMKMHTHIGQRATQLLNVWWSKIETSKKAQLSQMALDRYVGTLQPGDIALLGTLVEGGQGLATGNNGRYLAVASSSKEAVAVRRSRIDKTAKLILDKGVQDFGATSDEVKRSLAELDENTFVHLIENLKRDFGLDALGKGFIYRIADERQIFDVAAMSEAEKIVGLSGEANFVPYDKGDREGNSWTLPTPFYIDWSIESVAQLNKDSGKKIPGSSRVQNKHLYSRRGFCWILTLNEQSQYLKARLREPGVFDVNAMSMFLNCQIVSEKFLVCLLNSMLIFKYKKAFLNGTSAFQINDARQIPVVIPNQQQLEFFENLFDRAATIKNEQYSETISDSIARERLSSIQVELDKAVEVLYEMNGA